MTRVLERRARRSRFWRICRIYFRRFRIAVWLLVLVLVGSLVYLNQIGLPGFVKRPLLQKLRAQGLDLQFSRLRLRWYQGLVAENVRFGRAGDPLSPQLSLGEVELLLNHHALARLQLQVDQLVLRQGRLVLPLAQTNSDTRALAVEHIQTNLRFLPGDQWSLDNFKADFAGARISLSGVVTNASSVADWEFFHGHRTEPALAGRWQDRLQRLANTLNRISFSARPELRLDVRGDARDLQSFTVFMVITAPDANTPWGTVSEGQFTARLFAADTNGTSRAEMSLEAADAKTPWAAARNFHLEVDLMANESETNLVRGRLEIATGEARTEWASATNALFSASWVHATTNPVPVSGEGRLRCDAVESKWGGARQFEVSTELSTPAAAELPAFDHSLAWWTNIQPYALHWACRALDLKSSKLAAESFASSGDWRAPKLSVTNLEARLYNGRLLAAVDLDVLSRAATVRLRSDFDPHRIAAVLTEAGRHWLEQYSWEEPPKVSGEVQLVLPAWTNRQPDWRAEVQPTLRLSGEFDITGGAYRQVQVVSAQSHFTYSNLCWHLPDLTLRRPEGFVLAEHRASDGTKDFYWRVHSDVDVHIARHLLEPETRRGFDLVSFTNPPVMDCEIWGRFHDPGRTGLKGQIALTNFSFRGEAASWLHTGLRYTNRVLEFYNPYVERGTQHARADGLLADFNQQIISLTNGFSTMDPIVIARAIGPTIAKAVEPYRFERPPIARVHGTIPMHGEEKANLHFDLSGGPFDWWRFHVPQIAGKLHWQASHLELQQVEIDFYGGKAGGSADFDFLPKKEGTDFKFIVSTTNVMLQALMADLSTRTNQLEGLLSGTVAVTQANTESWSNTFGYGDLDLRDGLIWDIPLFGIFTPVLNGISPGLGNSRAGAATCTFTVTNGVVRSEDLEIRSPAVRLLYRGTVDFQSHLKARVEAELLRDVWLVGPIVSTVLWPVTKMFEYKLSGTLNEPKTEPVYIIPKLVLMPFHPFRMLKSLLPPEPPPRTNSPPVFQNLPPN